MRRKRFNAKFIPMKPICLSRMDKLQMCPIAPRNMGRMGESLIFHSTKAERADLLHKKCPLIIYGVILGKPNAFILISLTGIDILHYFPCVRNPNYKSCAFLCSRPFFVLMTLFFSRVWSK